MEANRLIQLLAICLELEPSLVSETASRENTEGWDSVVHLSLLGLLEDELPGVLDRLPKLAETQSVAEILKLINGL
jgi:hypothetical protein